MSVVTTSQVQGNVPLTVLHLHDRINMGNSDQVTQAARAAFDQGARHMVIDLAGEPSLTSAGPRAILAIHQMLWNASPEAGQDASKSTGKKSRYLKLCQPTDLVRQVLDISGFERYPEIFDTLPEAVAAFK